MIYVKKRDGRKVQFNQEKILNVYKKVLNSTHPDDVLSNDEERLAVSLTQDTCNLIFTIKDELSVEQIQDIVQKVLINNGLVQEAKNFITYRNERTAKRDYNSALNKTYRQMLTSKAQDMDLMRENANIDGNSVMGTMLRVGTEATKNFAHEYVLKPEYSYAHKNGDMHIHDLDFSLLTFNCVTGDTKLFIKENGIQKVVNADYFKELGEGTHELKDFEILSKNGFVRLSHVHIRKETDHVNEISSRYSKICLTDKHIVPVLRDSKEIEVEAKDIQENDILINANISNIDSSNNYFNIADMFDIHDENAEKVFVVDCGLKDILHKNHLITQYYDDCVQICSNSKKEYYYKRDIPLPIYVKYRDIFMQNGIDENDLSVKYTRSKNNTIIPLKIKLTSELGWLMGMIYSEGYISDYGINISNKDQRIVDKLNFVIKDIFPNANVGNYENENGVKIVYINGKLISLLCQKYLMHQNNSYDINIQNWMFTANNEFLKGLISGFVDGDGYVSSDDKSGYVGMASASKNFIDNMRILLKKFNVDTIRKVDIPTHEIEYINETKFTRDNYCYRLGACLNKFRDVLTESVKYQNCSGQNTDANYTYSKGNKVIKVVKVPYDDFVYDFTTEDHYFVANDIVVHNCCQVPVGKLLKKGFSTGHGFLRQPKSIPSASSLCCISIQSNQNDMYGGQGVATFEYDLAPYVAKSYAKNLKKVIEIIIGRDITDDDLAVFIDALYEKNQTVFSKESQKEIGKFISFIVKDKVDYCLKKARSMTENDTYQAMEALVHNLNTMQCLTGDQDVDTLELSCIDDFNKLKDYEKSALSNLILELSKTMSKSEIAKEINVSDSLFNNIIKELNISL